MLTDADKCEAITTAIPPDENLTKAISKFTDSITFLPAKLTDSGSYSNEQFMGNAHCVCAEKPVYTGVI